MDPLALSSQRTAYLFGRTDTGSRVGRLQEGLASPLQREWHIDRGTLDSRRITSTHQLARTKSSLPCHSNVCETSMSCSNFSRQPSGSCVHKSDGGDTLSAAVQAGNRVLGLVHETSDHNSCGAPARQIECACRLRVPPPIRLQRLETESRDLFTTECSVQSFYDRPVCLTLEQTSEPFFQFETRSAGIGSGCSGSLMGSRAPICISPLRSNRSLPAESTQRADEITTADSPNLASPNLVPSSTVNAEQQSSDPPIISRPTPESSAGAAPVDPERPSYASRVAHIRNTLSNQGISQESADIICKSWRKGTTKSYESAWKRWVSWCEQRNTNPLSASLADILQFLTDLYKEGKEYSTVNTHRSAISMSHMSIDGVVVGKHPTVCRLMQGIFNSRPPKPKYRSVWNVDTVVVHTQSMEPSDKLSLKDLSWKLVTLMALTNADRASDLHALDLRYRSFSPEGVTFEILGLTKTRRSGPPRQAFYPSFPEKSVCPVETLRHYESRTIIHRPTGGVANPLFISYSKPHKPVQAATISRWIRNMLVKAGVDSNFKAHSTRAASTSAAKNRGVTTKDIMCAADWSRESTFQRFYYKPVDNSFGKAVLQAASTGKKVML